jgi:hypothetical protein
MSTLCPISVTFELIMVSGKKRDADAYDSYSTYFEANAAT